MKIVLFCLCLVGTGCATIGEKYEVDIAGLASEKIFDAEPSLLAVAIKDFAVDGETVAVTLSNETAMTLARRRDLRGLKIIAGDGVFLKNGRYFTKRGVRVNKVFSFREYRRINRDEVEFNLESYSSIDSSSVWSCRLSMKDGRWVVSKRHLLIVS